MEEVFPERAYEHSSMFNWTDLERLNAGEWFLQVGAMEPWHHSSCPAPLGGGKVWFHLLGDVVKLDQLSMDHI